MRFLGNIEAKIDTKGRAFLPATFRKILSANGEETLVVRKDVFQSCLILYPESTWIEQIDLLRSKLNRWDAQQQQLFRQFISDAEQVSLDSNGRFLISKRHIQATNLKQSIRFLGMGDNIEIWNNEEYDKQMLPQEKFSKGLQDIMSSGNDKKGEVQALYGETTNMEKE